MKTDYPIIDGGEFIDGGPNNLGTVVTASFLNGTQSSLLSLSQEIYEVLKRGGISPFDAMDILEGNQQLADLLDFRFDGLKADLTAHNENPAAHQAMLDDKFGGLNSVFGYKKINGLILQWGETAQIVPENIPSNTVIASQLPIVFPNAFLTAIATPYDYTNGGFLATQLQVAINASSSTSQVAFLCRLLTATGSWCKIKYLAIGY